MAYERLYVKDARVWIPNSLSVWESAILTKRYTKEDNMIYLKLDLEGKEVSIVIDDEKDLPPLRNPPILIGQNDLTALSFLHEPDVLYNLEVRFRDRQSIYTYCGIILVAINPYAELPLYGQDLIRAYRGHSLGELEPHIFAIAEDAYTKLEREKCNLSIIVSGESGAGKTVNAKYAMRYFAAVGGNESETQIERKVLASSPIMEAIGNAKTIRNDNSSRFGKFTKLLFTTDKSNLSLTGATMQTYLLEKSRVVFQAPGERNYHIFYQLCAAREKYPELMLSHQNEFRFLNQGNSPDIARVSDLDQFSETLSALSTLGFTSEDINNVIVIAASIIHLGNVRFSSKVNVETQEINTEECAIDSNDIHFGVFSDLLQLDVKELKKWLTNRQIESVNELVIIPINVGTAEAARDALAKHIYYKLFQYIVEIINNGLNSGRKPHCFIGVLDIYGFETFDTNSFEQFCINYANEKLQQQFNQHVFKLEQEEYLREGIVWTMIDFYDNQPCIDLIEAKLGILDLLDDECRMPRGSDQSWVQKLNEKCSQYSHFQKTKFGNSSFIIRHFSDDVKYEGFGFLEKNRDTVSKQLINVLGESGMPLCRKLMLMDERSHLKEDLAPKPVGTKLVVSAAKIQNATADVPRKRTIPSKQHKKTVGTQFRESLSLLINTLHSTTPHYVRCIKPNDNKTPFEWEPAKIVQQLRACGVLETIRISAAGFPSRWTYEDFYDRYHLLCKERQTNEEDIPATCRIIVMNTIKDEDKFRYGLTQIFFRAGQVAYLEQLRVEIRMKSIIKIQSLVKRFVYQRRYVKIRKSVLGIQARARGKMARHRAQIIRENRAVVIIQKHIRGWLARIKFCKLKRSVLAIQTFGRGFIARREFRVNLDNHKATIIQKFCRGYLARLEFKKKLDQIIKCQAAVRRFLARRRFKRLKVEARNVVALTKGFENKIFKMQQKMDEIKQDNLIMKKKIDEIPEMKMKLEFLKNLEIENKSLKEQVDNKMQRILQLENDLTKEKDEKMEILDEKSQIEKEFQIKTGNLKSDNDNLLQTINNLKVVVKEKSQTGMAADSGSIDIQEAYQRTVREKEWVENENLKLKELLMRNQLIENNNSAQDNSNHMYSLSNFSFHNEDEDFGYSSSKNTLEIRRSNENTTKKEDKSSKLSSTAIILRLRRLLEEEKRNGELMASELERKIVKNSNTLSEDSIRLSELEIENEKLRQDYEALKAGVIDGKEIQILKDQFLGNQEELKRRREECIQLKMILSEQNQSLRSAGSNLMGNDIDRFNDSSDILEAFHAQKIVNRQLESELTALTEEHNAKLIEFNHKLDEIRNEKTKLQVFFEEEMKENTEPLAMGYLKYELEAMVMENVKEKETNSELRKVNQILIDRLREHGLNDSIVLNEETKNMVTVKKKAQIYQGIFKYQHEDESKIIQRIVTDYTPKIAASQFPGLPAFVILMCIRYTDLLNTDQHVRTLLTNFMLQSKKFYQLQKPTEYKVLWLVNMIKIYNLLRQYGGLEECMKTNTVSQNQQQLKNFDLAEYRRIIYEKIIVFYQLLVKQIQEHIKPLIVPAVLEHDEMTRSKKTVRQSTANFTETEPVSLTNKLEFFFKQFQSFGLEMSYTCQIYKQIFAYINAIALNNLMLRSDLNTWRTGMRLCYNIGCLRNWVREIGMPLNISDSLEPLTEVSALLQLRKSEEDVQSICDLCPNLTPAQILKIIKSYRLDDAENPITPAFISKLTKQLNHRLESYPKEIKTFNETLFTVDENACLPFSVAYEYSDVKLEHIELPSSLNLQGVLTKI